MATREPVIYQENETTWRVYYYPNEFADRLKSPRLHSLKDAKRFLKDIKVQIDNLNEKRSTIAFLGYYYIKVKRDEVKDTSLYAIKGIINRYIIKPYGKQIIKDFVKLDFLLKVKKRIIQSGYSRTTIRHIAFYIKDMMELAESEGYITAKERYLVKKTFKKFKDDKIKKPTKKTVLDWEQFILLLTYLKNEHSKWFVFFLVLGVTAMRRGEILALKRKSVDLEKGIITVELQAVNLPNKHRITATESLKTENSYRTIPIPKYVCKVLEEFFKEVRITNKPEAFVFFGQSHPLGTTTVGRELIKIREKCGLGKITLHTFRRSVPSMISQLQLTDEERYELQQRMGHKNFSTTANDYIVTNDNESSKFVEFFDKKFKGENL